MKGGRGDFHVIECYLLHIKHILSPPHPKSSASPYANFHVDFCWLGGAVNHMNLQMHSEPTTQMQIQPCSTNRVQAKPWALVRACGHSVRHVLYQQQSTWKQAANEQMESDVAFNKCTFAPQTMKMTFVHRLVKNQKANFQISWNREGVGNYFSRLVILGSPFLVNVQPKSLKE